MARFHNKDGVKVPFTPAEEASADARETAHSAKTAGEQAEQVRRNGLHAIDRELEDNKALHAIVKKVADVAGVAEAALVNDIKSNFDAM